MARALPLQFLLVQTHDFQAVAKAPAVFLVKSWSFGHFQALAYGWSVAVVLGSQMDRSEFPSSSLRPGRYLCGVPKNETFWDFEALACGRGVAGNRFNKLTFGDALICAIFISLAWKLCLLRPRNVFVRRVQ